VVHWTAARTSDEGKPSISVESGAFAPLWEDPYCLFPGACSIAKPSAKTVAKLRVFWPMDVDITSQGIASDIRAFASGKALSRGRCKLLRRDAGSIGGDALRAALW